MGGNTTSGSMLSPVAGRRYSANREYMGLSEHGGFLITDQPGIPAVGTDGVLDATINQMWAFRTPLTAPYEAVYVSPARHHYKKFGFAFRTSPPGLECHSYRGQDRTIRVVSFDEVTLPARRRGSQEN